MSETLAAEKTVISHILGVLQGKHPMGAARSGRWAKVRSTHLEQNPTCAVCNGSKKIEVHHIRPFHLHPELELDPKNLISLCEAGGGGLNCHLAFGHLGNFKSYNTEIRSDSALWSQKIKDRP